MRKERNDVLLVRDIMTSSLITIHQDTFIAELAGVFVDHKIGGAPVLNDAGDVVGFVSTSDLVSFNATGDDGTYVTVKDIAHAKVFTVDVQLPVSEAAQIFLDEHVHHVSVVDGDNLVGMVSTFDFVEIAARKQLRAAA